MLGVGERSNNQVAWLGKRCLRISHIRGAPCEIITCASSGILFMMVSLEYFRERLNLDLQGWDEVTQDHLIENACIL